MAMTKVKNLQMWCKKMAEGYRDVEVRDMDKSWKSGLAFCAIIHRFRPDLIDYDSLSKENVFENNNLAFEVAEKKLGIPAFLEAADMVAIRVPDKLSVVTYVSQYYNYFHDKPQDGGPEVMKFVGGVKRKEAAAAEDKSLTPQEENGKTATIGDKCSICSGKVYLLERQIEAGKLYHRACFRNSELSPTSKVFKRHSVDQEKDLPEQKHRKLELEFDSPEKKSNFWQQHNQTQAKQDDASKMEFTVNNVNKASNNEEKLSEIALPIKDVQKKQDAASVISKVLPGFGSDAATNEAKLPKRNKVNIAEKLKELEEQNLKNATAANAAVFKNSDNKAGVSDKSSVLGKDTQSKSDIASQPKPKPRVHVATTSEKMVTDEPVSPSQPKPVPRFQKSSEVASPQSTPMKDVNRSKSPVEHREKKITPPMRPKTQFVPLKDTNASTESGSSLPPLPSSTPPKLPDSQTPKLSHHKKITIVSQKASSKQLSPIDDVATSSGTNASGFALHKPPSKPPRVTAVLDNQSNVKPMDINEIREPAKAMNKDPAIGKSVALDVTRPEEKEKEVKGGLLKSLADVRNKQETVGDVKTGGVKTRVFTKIGEKSDSSHNFSAGTESSDKKLDSAKTQPPRPKSAFVPSASSLTADTSVSAPPGVTQVTTTTKTTTKTKVFHNYKKSEPSNGIEAKTETKKSDSGSDVPEWKRKLEEKNLQKDRPKSADLLIDKPKSDVQVFHNYKKSEPSNGIEAKTETNKSDSVSDVPEWKRKLEEKNMQKDRPKSADLLIDKPKSDVQVLDWQKEAEKRKEARKGSYVDPEIGPGVVNVNNNNKQERSDNVIQSNQQLRKPARPKTEDVSDEHIPKRPEKGPTIPERPKTQADMIKTSPKLSDQNNRISEPTKSPERRKIHVSDTKFNGTEVKDEEVHKKKITVDTKFKFEVIDSKKGPEKPPAPSVLAEMPKSTKPHPARPPPPAANTSPKLGRQHISPEQIQRQLRLIDSKLTMLEIKGRKLEDTIRNVSEEDDELMISWFQLVNEKNDLVRMENDFIYLNREQELEIEQDELELHLRRLVETPEDQKTDEDRNEEEELIEKKMEIINQRNKIVDCIDQDRLRYLEEDHEIEAMLKMKAFKQIPEQTPKKKKGLKFGLSKGKKLVR
ncbi:MICAL-like protein 1 isoform X1 [Dreissena polymorpha]|uniref:MICAL-like protein 1 isoform X1 n=1 Tax=Dreissena polymorpha TaxID=45954 RepID=UPI002265423D|nr:MICAL-like protein 1 isoform X1 [Dreissena polymorpha]XP_052267197.1 MICAL-like protein 1 isoform X1 [Dreissena polymorpha]XP_052267198.1 MICAL-like protein 1 isoform X1 [Dreissena polymorpha]